MPGSIFNAACSPQVQRILQRYPGVNTSVSLDDEMLLSTLREHDWDFALTSYFERGRQSFESQRQIETFYLRDRTDFDTLDFAAGFGRATRFLVRAHGRDNVWITDIQPGAVAFQEEILGCQTIPASLLPEHFEPGRTFDCVVTHSFFSHVPPHRFGPWLRALSSCLSPGGVLVFSVHDETLLQSKPDLSGITFRPSSESDRLDPSEYGTTWVSSEYVIRQVKSHCIGKNVVRWPRGLANFQDLYIVYPDADVVEPELDQGPFGYASIARVIGSELDLIGWASHWQPARSVERVIVDVAGAILGETSTFFERPDVVDHLSHPRHLRSGWHLRLTLPRTCSLQTDILAIRAVSDRGLESFLYVGTIAALLLESCRSELAAAGRLGSVVLPEGAEDPLAPLYGKS